MTKKEAMMKLKGDFRNAVTATKMKNVKELYAEVKNLDLGDNDNVPENVEQRISNV